MNILRIIYDWPNPWQGLAAHPYEVTLAQKNEGHKIAIFCGTWPSEGGPVSIPDVKINPIFREPYPNTIFFTSSVVLFFKYLSYRARNQVDIVHSHGHFGIWIYAYRAFLKKFFPWAKELKTPLVVHFHNTARGRWNNFKETEKAIKPGSQYVGWPMAVLSDKLACYAASACVFVSETNKKEAIDLYGVFPQKCFLIETGVNAELFKPVGDEEVEKSRKEAGFDRYDKIVLYHGVLNERKNVKLLLETVQYLPKDYSILLSGSGDPSYVQELNEYIELAKIGSRVVQTGYTPYPYVPTAYQISNIFVLPSSWEGLPKAVMQGLACGVPCLVSGFKVSEDIGGLFYINKLEPKELADQIIQIVESRQQVDLNKIKQDYSWSKKIKQIDEVYDYAIKNYI